MPGVRGVTWSGGSLEDGAEVYACVGGEVELSWDVDTTPSDDVGFVQWYYKVSIII